MVTLTFDPKINMVLPLPQGNHVAKFGKDPIYRTKVIAQKPVWTPARHTQSHNTSLSRDGCMKTLYDHKKKRNFISESNYWSHKKCASCICIETEMFYLN